VLKDGKLVDEMKSADIAESDLHEKMVGRKRDADYYKEDMQRTVKKAPILKLKHINCNKHFKDVSLDIRPGEILGIGGVLGSGKEVLGKALAGIQKWDSGKAQIYEKKMSAKEYMKKIKSQVGYIPRERHLEGIILYLSVAWNLTLAGIDLFTKTFLALLQLKKEKLTVNKYIKKLNIKTSGRRTLAVHLSGGNQQKVVFAKLLLREPKILVLDSPTRGMDAGAKEEIYALLRTLAEKNMAIILISDELLELIGLSNRIILMKDGRITHSVETPVENKPAETELIKYMV
jgi:ribose transport system ATP-binding protein